MNHALILEDKPESRQWLAEIVSCAFPGCRIHEADSLAGGMAAVGETAFDLALIDLGLPDGSGIGLLRHLSEHSPATLCAIVTVVGEDTQIVAALAAGAHGYLLKDQPDDLLRSQLLHLADGLPALSPSVARRLMDHFRLTGPASDCDRGLSDREKEILSLIARGFRNRDAAGSLGIAESTIASHIKSIYRKLGISTRAEASWHATRMGL